MISSSGSAGRRSRRKGKAWERALVRRLQPFWPSARRGWWQARGGDVVPDIDQVPYWIEATHSARPNIRAKMRQAVGYLQPGDPRLPVVISKRDQEDALVTMRLDDWLLIATEPDKPT